MAIASRARGASDTTVKLSDGTITTLSAFLATPGALTITGIAKGAGNPTIKDSTGLITGLAEHSKATVNVALGTQTVAFYAKSANNTSVVDGAGRRLPLSEYQAATDGVAVAEKELADDNGGAVVVTKETPAAAKINSDTTKQKK